VQRLAKESHSEREGTSGRVGGDGEGEGEGDSDVRQERSERTIIGSGHGRSKGSYDARGLGAWWSVTGVHVGGQTK
jgi:hypothetical protein